MELLQFYAVPHTTLSGDPIFPVMNESLAFDINISLNGMELDDNITLMFYMEDDDEPFFIPTIQITDEITPVTVEKSQSLVGTFNYSVEFKREDIPTFGKLTILVSINGEMQGPYSKFFIQDGDTNA